MKTLTHFLIAIFACAVLTATGYAGPEPMQDSKDAKTVAPVPSLCDWTGFYIGLHAGYQFGDSETEDLDGYNTIPGDTSSYDQSGFVGGGQIGYNFQWNWLVFGLEGDVGYMNVDGSGIQPASAAFFNGDTVASTQSDFYGTFRARLGVAFHKWLFYGTGGGIVLNYDTRVLDTSIVFPGTAVIDAHDSELNWGWTVGGGVEYMLNCHWSVKVEYLYFQLDDQTFSGTGVSPGGPSANFAWRSETDGNIVRGGLNYKF